MKRFALMILTIMLVSGLFACAPVAPPTQPAEPVDGYYPLTTRTGIAAIDAVLEAAASGDVEELRLLFEFTNAQCTQREGLGGPPKCRAGEAEGTAVEALPFLGSEGGFLRRDEIENWQGIDVTGLYAIYEVSPAVSSEQYYPVGTYAILFLGQKNQPTVALRIGERGIVRVDDIFDSSPESLSALVQREASRVILAPPAR
jgi:hypothetical protein